MIRFLRDWARGFTNADIISLQIRLRQLATLPTGETIWLTNGETMALRRGRVIGVWRISTLSVKHGRALVSLRLPHAAGA